MFHHDEPMLTSPLGLLYCVERPLMTKVLAFAAVAEAIAAAPAARAISVFFTAMFPSKVLKPV